MSIASPAKPARSAPHPSSRRASSPLRADRDQVMVFAGSWDDYERLDAEFPGRRLRISYLDGYIQIMSTSMLHELIKSNIGRLIDAWCLDHGIHFAVRGQATQKRPADRAGEPDESYIFDRKATTPQLVVEVALTSGGLDKLQFWGGFPVEEVWLWKRKRLHCYRWHDEGYQEVKESQLVAGLKLEWIERLAESSSTFDMLREFRAGFAKTKKST